MNDSRHELTSGGTLQAIFGVVVRPRTYARILYTWLAFPLGLAYFTAFVTLLAVGMGLIIVWVGLLILAMTAAFAWGVMLFERAQATLLLGTELGAARRMPEDARFRSWAKSVVKSSAFWKGWVFLALKFPLGLVGWTVSVVSFSVSLAFFFAPIAVFFGGSVDLGPWWIDDTSGSLALSLVGAVMTLLTLHLHDAMGWAWGEMARLLLQVEGVPAAAKPEAPAGNQLAPAVS
jgi:hypothetical protein